MLNRPEQAWSTVLVAGFELDSYSRWRPMEGPDGIALTLRHVTDIADHERTRVGWLPTTTPAR